MATSVQEGIRKARANGVDDRAIAAYLAEREDVGDQVKKALADPGVTATDIVNYLSESEFYRAGEKSPTAQRFVGTALQGPTLGFGNKISAGLAALPIAYAKDIPIGEAYQQALDYATGQTQSFQKQYGKTAAVSQGLASLPLAGLMPARAATAPGFLGRTAAASGTGAGFGATQAAGESRFGVTDPEFWKEVQTGAKYGAMFGGGAQAALPVLGAVAGGPMRQVTSRIPGLNFAKDYAEQKVAQSIMRGMPEAPGLQPLTQAQAKLRAMGPEGRIADVAPSTLGLLDTTATLPGRTQSAVERAIRERQVGSAGRIMAGAEEALGQKAAATRGTVARLEQERKLLSKPYYDVVDRATVTIDDDLYQLLQRTKSAHKDAEKLATWETGLTPDYSSFKVGDTIPFRALDDIKKSVDDVVSTAKREGAGSLQVKANEANRALVAKLKAVSPQVGGKSAYEQALEGYAGHSRLIDAVDTGRSAMTAKVDDIIDEMQGMTAGELDAFRMGAIQSLREKAGTEAGRTQLLKFWKEPNTQDRLRQIFGNDYRKFAATLLREGKLRPFESVGRGSKTAQRQAGMADIDVAPLSVATETAVAAKTGAVSPGMVQQLVARLGQVQVPEPVRDEIGRILLSRNPADFDRLRQVMAQLNATQRRQVVASGLLGGQAEKWFLD